MTDEITVQVPDRLDGEFIDPEDVPFDVYVDYGEHSRIFEVNETDLGKDHAAYRNFTIDGGIPACMLDDDLVEAIAGKIGLHIQSVVNIV